MEKQVEHYTLKRQINIDWVASIIYYEFTKDFNFSGEAHNYWEFVYADKGEVIATAVDEDVFLKQGDMIFHEPNEFHRIRSNGIVAPNVIVISFYSTSPAMDFFKKKRITVPEKHRWLLGKMIQESRNLFHNNSITPKNAPAFGSEHLLLNYLETFLLLLMREDKDTISFSQSTAFENSIVCEIIRIMEENIYENIDITSICRKLGYSKTYICTLFKKYTDAGIMHYFTNMKIREAKRILREKSMNVSQTSDILKFDNSHYFSKVFRRFTGMSPREYMKSVDKVIK